MKVVAVRFRKVNNNDQVIIVEKEFRADRLSMELNKLSKKLDFLGIESISQQYTI